MKIFSWVHRHFHHKVAKNDDHDKAKEDTLMSNQALFFDNNDVDNDEMESLLELKASDLAFDHVEIENLSPFDEVSKPNIHLEDVVVNNSAKIVNRERITLADLLRADSEKNTFNDNENDNDNAETKSFTSFLISKAKKKLMKHDSDQPIKKTKQLIRKMLRKKIHPDIGIQKSENPSIVCQEMDMHAI
ncbi:hypothetical protein E3N88_19434 [Mikania micrantha]|uniref:Protein TILLER ANGLE CONTROL 1 n=1 Tax=Mikania micrantha TaxID=192012 RepID=A0A5N6NQY2_9ASTR|nr:hypothetical protein E3N88_19434 [Mikania micrantha]